MIPDHLISTTANQCLLLHLFHHCPERTVNPPDLPLATFPAAVIKDTQLFHFIVLITCNIPPSHTPHIITQTSGTLWSPPTTQVFTKTISILLAALLAPTSRGRMMTMPLQPHRAATPLTQRIWMMKLTTDARTTSSCSNVILRVCVCVWLCFTSTCTTIYHIVPSTRDSSQDFVYADLPKKILNMSVFRWCRNNFFNASIKRSRHKTRADHKKSTKLV